MDRPSPPLPASATPAAAAGPNSQAALLPAAPARRYHHGNLRQALLEAAEAILREDGIGGLKLRAIARRAGVSHTAADPHFGDLKGLLSELAASGFERLSEAMAQPLPAAVPAHADPRAQKIAHGYIGFALANPQLFVLMFRRDVLDRGRPRLQAALAAAFRALSSAAGSDAASDHGPLPLAAAGGLIGAWGVVHGIATLAITDHLAPLLDRIVPAAAPERWIDAALSSLGGGQAGRIGRRRIRRIAAGDPARTNSAGPTSRTAGDVTSRPATSRDAPVPRQQGVGGILIGMPECRSR